MLAWVISDYMFYKTRLSKLHVSNSNSCPHHNACTTKCVAVPLRQLRQLPQSKFGPSIACNLYYHAIDMVKFSRCFGKKYTLATPLTTFYLAITTLFI